MRRMLPLLLTLALLCALPLGGGAEHALNSVTWRKPVLVERIEQITQPILRLAVGNRLRLDCRVLPENADNPVLLWSSSNEAVAAVDGGILVCVGAGKCIVTAEAADDSGVQTQWRVTVEAAKVQAIRPVTQSPCHLHVGDTIRLEYRIEPESLQGAPITWRSSDERVATVADGVVTCVGEGRCSITASPEGPANSCSWQMHVAEHFLWDGELTQTVAIPGTDLTLRLPEGWSRQAAMGEAQSTVYGNSMIMFMVITHTVQMAPVMRKLMLSEDAVRSTFTEQFGLSPEDICGFRRLALGKELEAAVIAFSVTDPTVLRAMGSGRQICIADAVFFRGDTLVELTINSVNPTLYQHNTAQGGTTLTDDAGDVLYADFLAILETLSAGA